MEAAVAPQERRDPSLIELDQEQQENLHSLPFSGAVLVSAQIGDEKSCSTKKAGKGVVNLTVRRRSNR